MGETLRTFIATTSEFGDERADGLAGVTVRYGTEEIEFLPATESRAPAWTRSAAHELLGIYGYETTGDWTDIGADDPIWEVPVAGAGDGLGCGGICPDCGPPPA